MKSSHKLTETVIAHKKAAPKQYEVAEPVTGLRLRVYPSGKKAFVWRYRDPAGVQRVVTLGAYPAITLAEARAKLGMLKQQAAHGDDPAESLRHEREAKRLEFAEHAASPTVADILTEYLGRHISTKRAATREQFTRVVNQLLIPRLGAAKAAEITRTAVVAALDDIADKRSRFVADHATQVLRAAFRFAVTRGRLEHNPCMNLPRYAERRSRDRVLTPAEIRAFWTRLNHPKGVSLPLALGMKLLLVTAQRRGSLMAARWEHVSADRWEIPAENFKSKHSHVVPLSRLAQELLGELRKSTGVTEWLFPNPSLTGPVHAHAATRALQRLGCNWRLHDLRRTGATLMAEAQVPRFTIARVLGHADSSVTAVYDRHAYVDEMGRALNKLALRLHQILEPESADNVIDLGRHA